MLNERIQEALNDQINAELFSSYLYLSMAAFFETLDMPGGANWMQQQAKEELLHVSKFVDYIHDRDGRVYLKAIDAPPVEWASALDAFQKAYEHEQYVSSRINDLVNLARQEGDHFTYNFLQWFVSEQVEEEATVKGIVQQLKLVGEGGHGLFMIDKELGRRVFQMPADPAAN